MMIHHDIKNNIFIKRKTSGMIPDAPFGVLKNFVLGKSYQLSLLFPDLKLSQKLHRDWQGIDTPVNILSFPLDKKSGEIIITLSQARKEAKNFGLAYHDHLQALFIHGLAHLKGYDHGTRMDAYEKKIRKKFGIPVHDLSL